jgi:hypothetical protein
MRVGLVRIRPGATRRGISSLGPGCSKGLRRSSAARSPTRRRPAGSCGLSPGVRYRQDDVPHRSDRRRVPGRRLQRPGGFGRQQRASAGSRSAQLWIWRPRPFRCDIGGPAKRRTLQQSVIDAHRELDEAYRGLVDSRVSEIAEVVRRCQRTSLPVSGETRIRSVSGWTR